MTIRRGRGRKRWQRVAHVCPMKRRYAPFLTWGHWGHGGRGPWYPAESVPASQPVDQVPLRLKRLSGEKKDEAERSQAVELYEIPH